MKKYLVISIMVFIIGMLVSCASPGSIRRDGIAFTYTTTKGTPQDFGRCLVTQLDERLPSLVHILRDNPDGNTTIISYAGGEEIHFVFDINKEVIGLNILVYFSWCNGEVCRANLLFPDINASLNDCGANEKK